MADGYARISGRPGVCFLIAGPGLLNAATAIAQAYSDSVPMLVVSSVASATLSGIPEGHIHELPSQEATMAGITAFSATARSPAEIGPLLARAFDAFASGRPRPVHIALPLDLLSVAATSLGDGTAAARAPLPHGELLREAAAALRTAVRPVLVIGGGAVNDGAAIVALAERLGAPMLTTIAGKGVVPDEHPLHYGAPLTTKAGQALVAEADVVLALGTELAAADTWTAPLRIRRLVRIDIDATPVRLPGPDDLFIHADLAAALPALAACLGRASVPNSPDGAGPAFRAALLAPTTPLESRHVEVLDALREAMPEDGFVAADMAQVAYTANRVFRCTRPRSYFYPAGLSTLGYALPAAIGAKLAAPERAGIVLTGDCGFLFTIAELATAVELELPIVVLLWNNAGLGQIRDHMVARAIPPVGVDPRNPDFLALARAFGCRTARPAGVQGLKREIRAALRRRVPTVIEIRETLP
jgi:5-guanidino-2-oxopentanoate decarboxylase